MNAVQACHDGNTARIDALEDRLTQTELRRANDIVAGYQQWAYERNRCAIGGGVEARTEEKSWSCKKHFFFNWL